MKKIASLLLTLTLLPSCSQTKTEYLKDNRFDLTKTNFKFPQEDFKILGFGAYHGSKKTEGAELALLKSLTNQKAINYYLPEIDFSLAHYFNKYLKTGDTILLKDLVTNAGIRVNQERTVEVYEKWKALKRLNDKLPAKDQLKVLGIDFQVNYKYVSKHIVEIIKAPKNTFKSFENVREMVQIDTTGYAFGDLSYADGILKKFVNDYESNTEEYQYFISDKKALNHIINNLKIAFNFNKLYRDRDKVIYDNYVALDAIYDFKNKPQFLRMGFSHLEKSREGEKSYPYFMTRLIENEFYTKNEIVSIIGYFTDSKVVWDEVYDDNGGYTGFTVEAGFGIGDYEKEYFRGIQHLKDSKVSDLMLFRLNKKGSPYFGKEPDLIEVVMQDEKSNTEAVKGMSTLDFIDYAVLISDSEASTPIFEMDKK